MNGARARNDDSREADVARLRVPPHSIEAEQSVLGGLLLDYGAFDSIAGLIGERHFWHIEHRHIWSAIVALTTAGKPADVITVHEQLASLGKAEDCGGLKYINALAQSVPSVRNIGHYAEIVREHAAKRALISVADEAASIAWSERGGDSKARLDRIATLFGELQRESVRKVPQRLAELLPQRLERLEALGKAETAPAWATGIPALDRKLNGGLRAGHLYVLAARPAVGKSSFAQQIGLALAERGLPVLMLSQEMPSEEVADRALSNIGGIEYGALQTGQLGEVGWSQLPGAVDCTSGMPFFVDDETALTIDDVRIKARLVKGLKLLVVDYLQLCESTLDSDRRNDQLEQISRGLKALAKDLGIAVLALSQLNRRVEERPGRRPILSDLRDSGAIEQDTDVVIFLWPVREHESEGRAIVGCEVAKQRQGKKGEFGLDFFGALMRWQESTADIRPPRPLPPLAHLASARVEKSTAP